MATTSGSRDRAPAGRTQEPQADDHRALPGRQPAREWLTMEQLAEYLDISASSAYRLAWKLGARRKPLVGLRVRRVEVDEYMAPQVDGAPGSAPQPGLTVACPSDDDDEEVLPGLTRRQLKEQAGF